MELLVKHLETITEKELIITTIIFILSIIGIGILIKKLNNTSTVTVNEVNPEVQIELIQSENLPIMYDAAKEYSLINLNLLSKLEGGVSYKTVNKSSGAFGKWQLLPKTAKTIAKRLNIPIKDIKLPKNQIKIAKYLREENYNQIIKHGYAPTFTIQYIYWQQGSIGANAILSYLTKGTPVPTRVVRNMLSNMPYAKGGGRTDFTSIDQWFIDWRDIVINKTISML